MEIISVLNHKGGVGKTTLATNIAGYFANKEGNKVMIGDFDVQQSSQNWLALRSKNATSINSWEFIDGRLAVPPDDITHIIIDSPAGISGDALRKQVSLSDKVVVPLRPGIFDILSTETFLEEIVEMINEQEKETKICVIGNMVDMRTKSTDQLLKFINGAGLPAPAVIRQAQIYVHLAAHGLTIFDSKSDIFAKELEQWRGLIDWLENN